MEREREFILVIDKLEEIDTEPYICSIIEDRLRTWPRQPKEHFIYDPLPKKTRLAMISQDILGWRPFVYGRLATTWEDAQEEWLIRTATRFKRSSQRWSATVVEYLLKIHLNMWENRNKILYDNDHP